MPTQTPPAEPLQSRLDRAAQDPKRNAGIAGQLARLAIATVEFRAAVMAAQVAGDDEAMAIVREMRTMLDGAA